MSEGSDRGRDSRPGQDVASANDQESGETRRNSQPAEAAEPAGQAADDGNTYVLYQRGLELLERGSAAAAAQLLERAAAAEPRSRSVLEALARAQFDAGRYAEAADNFRLIVEASPSDDYAHFGLGLALARTGDPAAAAEHLALAAAMRPDTPHYTEALRSVRATLRARGAARGPAEPGGSEDSR
jgi:Flp pilus assembly protein TadD